MKTQGCKITGRRKWWDGRAVGNVLTALVTVAVLLAAVEIQAESDTAEVRPTDLPERTENTEGLPEALTRSLEQARKSRLNIEAFHERFGRKLEQLDEIFKDLDLRTVEGQAIAKQEMLGLLDDLEDEAESIEAAHGSVMGDLQLYREALAKAPAAFTAVAGEFGKLGQQEDDEFLKEQYLDFADTARKLATRYEARSQSLGNLEKEIDEKMAYVAKSRKFITHVRSFLDIIPADNGIETERFVKRLNEYIKGFQDAVRAMKGIADQLGEDPKPTADPNADKPLPKAAATAPAKPIGIAEYRSRLAEIRR